MNKIFCFLICIMLLSSSAEAQYFKGGLRAGITGNQVDGDNLGGYNKPGLSFGAFVNRELNFRLKWQVEFYYTMKGAAKITSTQDPYMYRMALHYVEMPFFMVYKFSEKIEGLAGPAVGYLWYGTRNTGAGLEQINYQIDKFDFSGIIGFSYIFSPKVSTCLKISHSLSSISREPGNLTWWGTYGQYNNQLDLSLYYTLQ